jgi:hypothetical protein
MTDWNKTADELDLEIRSGRYSINEEGVLAMTATALRTCTTIVRDKVRASETGR